MDSRSFAGPKTVQVVIFHPGHQWLEWLAGEGGAVREHVSCGLPRGVLTDLRGLPKELEPKDSESCTGPHPLWGEHDMLHTALLRTFDSLTCLVSTQKAADLRSSELPPGTPPRGLCHVAIGSTAGGPHVDG